MHNHLNGEKNNTYDKLEKSGESEFSTMPQIIAERTEQVSSFLNQLLSKLDSEKEKGLESPREELSSLIYYCDVPESWPKEKHLYNYLLCDRMQIPCIQFPSRILCSKWHQLYASLAQELTSAIDPSEIPQSYNLRIRYWENKILPIIKSSYYDTIYVKDGVMIPEVFRHDQSSNHDENVLTIYPHAQEEIRSYNNKKYDWFQTFEMNWFQKYTDIDFSYHSLISEIRISFDSIISEHLNPSFPVIVLIDDYLEKFKEFVKALEKYEPEILTLDRNDQIIQNFISYYIFRQLPDFIGFLEELKSDIQNHPSKTREIITKAYNKKKSIPKTPPKPKTEYLLDIWEGGSEAAISYNKVIRKYQSKINFDMDKPLINPDGTWTRGKASKSFLQAFLKTCMSKGHVRDCYSSAELARVLKNTFKLNSLSPTGYTSQILELLDDIYLDFFSDMPE